MTELLVGREIIKYYGKDKVLDISEITIKHGSILALMGPNGSGKTTLIKILSQLEEKNTGEIYYQGEKINKRDSLKVRRKIGFIWQKPLLYRGSVYDNIALGLKYRKMGKDEIQKRVAQVIDRLKIINLKDKDARKLSGGEQQKVSIARTLVTEPELIFIDEPNTSLDIESIGLVEEIIKEEVRKGVSIVLVTHNFYQAKNLADEIIILRKGKLVAQGGAEQIFTMQEELLKCL
ncbi:ATP-binding cassette domain-containing protein [Halocella sp. SP3-1]|uniref:energy-coupling factor ABC transporter ATP-binding protein n=1 Tax=Halocella sp. SP3-1 TaxID=2382161 RepID=UPI000F757A3B|nr:ATP-binding cassette domain-containing protein [Halocella sp. SP3-1]AZO96023.1 ATP-binding cassette domain-containing protein [Halocella sp. SP3-1]